MDISKQADEVVQDAQEKQDRAEIEFLIHVMQGRNILDIEEDTDASDEKLLSGMRRFIVTSVHDIGSDRPCEHLDTVLKYRDRYILLSLRDVMDGKLKAAVEELAKEK